MIRTLQHPGVEINEIDLSQYTAREGQTRFLIPGFSSAGEELTPVEITSKGSFIDTFGEPSTDAEKYFYYATANVLDEQGAAICIKLPYQDTRDQYNAVKIGFTHHQISALGYPLYTDEDPASGICGYAGGDASALYNNICNQLIDNVVSATSYISMISGEQVLSSGITSTTIDEYQAHGDPSAFYIVNVARNFLELDRNDEEKSGHFIVLLPPVLGLPYQNISVSATSAEIASNYFDTASGLVSAINTLTQVSGVPDGAITNEEFYKDLSGVADSISYDLTKYIPAFRQTSNGKYDRNQFKQLTILVCKTVPDSNYENKLNVQVLESWTGTFVHTSLDPYTNQSTYLPYLVNGNSKYIKILHDTDYPLSGAFYHIGTGYNIADITNHADLFSFNSADDTKQISGSAILADLNTALAKLDNIDEETIDVVVDAGISTIAQYMNNTAGKYEPSLSGGETASISSKNDVATWNGIETALYKFCQNTRKDCMAVLDGPRQLVLNLDEKRAKTSALFDTQIANKLYTIQGLNSNYAAIYINWLKYTDIFTSRQIWLPPSVFVAGILARTDANYNVWDAPAGLNRGKMLGVTDVSFQPNYNQANQIYLKSLNYAKLWPMDGPTIEGQKTTQAITSAFDRVNVRRLFLRLERIVYRTCRYFVYEPNNSFTRMRLLDQLTPTFERIKMQGGIYDYRLVCDESNNTPDVIDNNELKLAVMIKPTKTAEHILVNVYALRTGGSFEEVVL